METVVATGAEVQVPAAAEPVNTGDAAENLAGVQQAAVVPAAEEQINQEVEAFKAKALDETKKRQAIEAENTQLKDQMAIVAANMRAQQIQATPVPQKSLYEQAADELGLQDEEFLTKEQQIKILTRVDEVRNLQYNTIAVQQQFLNQHPDFAEVVGTGNPKTGNFVPSPSLQRIIDKKPQIAQAIASSPQAAQLAYYFVTNDPEYIAAQAEAQLTPAQRSAKVAADAVKVARKQTSISAANGGGGNLDKKAAIDAMSGPEFAAYKEALKAKAI